MMIVKLVEAPSVLGGTALALCDAEGRVLGRQSSCQVGTYTGSLPSVTVSFDIDGEHVRFAEELLPAPAGRYIALEG